jgi:hypothetical protein
MLLAGIQKKSLDVRLRGHDGWLSDTRLCGAVLSGGFHARRHLMTPVCHFASDFRGCRKTGVVLTCVIAAKVHWRQLKTYPCGID